MIIHSQGFKPLAMRNSGMARNSGLKPGVTQESTPQHQDRILIKNPVHPAGFFARAL